jgi:hypothetical protein
VKLRIVICPIVRCSTSANDTSTGETGHSARHPRFFALTIVLRTSHTSPLSRSDLVPWPGASISSASYDFRSWRRSGNLTLVLSFTGYDPGCLKTHTLVDVENAILWALRTACTKHDFILTIKPPRHFYARSLREFLARPRSNSDIKARGHEPSNGTEAHGI